MNPKWPESELLTCGLLPQWASIISWMTSMLDMGQSELTKLFSASLLLTGFIAKNYKFFCNFRLFIAINTHYYDFNCMIQGSNNYCRHDGVRHYDITALNWPEYQFQLEVRGMTFDFHKKKYVFDLQLLNYLMF